MTTTMLILGLLFGLFMDTPDAPADSQRVSTARYAAGPVWQAQGPSAYPSWNIKSVSLNRVRVWTNAGFGVISNQYNGDNAMEAIGSNVALPTSLRALAGMLGQTSLPLPDGADGTVTGAGARVSGSLNVVNFHVGGAYAIVSKPAYSLSLGADLGFAQQDFQADKVTLNTEAATVFIPDLDGDGVPEANNVPLNALASQMGLTIPASISSDQKVESGFKAQSLLLFGEWRNKSVSARAGYQFDIGPDANAADNQRENTDWQNAVLLGASVRHHLQPALIFFGGVDAYLTMEGKVEDTSFDRGDLYGVNTGFGYSLGFGEIGAAFTFRYRTEGDVPTVFGDQVVTSQNPKGYHIGVAPYVNISPMGSAYTVYVKGGVQDEYRDYTVSLAGENDFAPQLGATFGLVYDF